MDLEQYTTLHTRLIVGLYLLTWYSQCVSGGQKFREVILRKCSDSAEYTPKLVNICSDSMKNTPPYLKVILRKCSDSAEYTLIFFDNQKEMVHYFVKEGLLLATFCPFYCKKRVYYSLHFFYTKITLGDFCPKSASETHCVID